MFSWQESDDRVARYVTHRNGGVSEGSFGGLNLGGHVGDDPDAVAENRRRLAVAVGASLVLMDQRHGADVAVVDEVPGTAPAVDALVTATSGLALAVLVADCVPVLLASPQGVVGAVHAGRAGMMHGVVPAAVAAMRALGAEELDAVVGPSVCGRCYEVPAEMAAVAAQAFPASAAVTRDGTPAIDVAAGVVAQLAAAGVAVRRLPGCTLEDERWYSYRRDGVTGRFAGVVVLGPR